MHEPTYYDAAAMVAANPPGVGDWPRRGANPVKSLANAIHRAGWPARQVAVTLPQTTRRGEPAPDAVGTVTVVPETWLRAMADVLAIPFDRACRGVVGTAGG